MNGTSRGPAHLACRGPRKRMSSDDAKFACPACGKQYRWKPELAGRSAKCACGAKLVVPSDAPATATGTATDPAPAAAAARTNAVASAPPKVAAAAPTSNCPICKSPVTPGAVLCVKCGYNFKTGKRLAAVVVETDDAEEEHDVAADPTAKSPPADKPPAT
jgi:hypothetical protein